jgi:hypothetical protein
VHGPGEGERIAAGTGSELLLKATAEDTGGSFLLSESTIEPGFPGPLRAASSAPAAASRGA